MTEFRTEIDIAADKDTVWGIISDFASYPSWNPLIVRVEGPCEPGASLALSVKVGALTLPVGVRVLSVTPGRQLRWTGPPSAIAGALLSAEHYFVVHERPEGGVRFVHGEEWRGALVPALGWWLDRLLAPGYRAYNEALKRRAEERMQAQRTTG